MKKLLRLLFTFLASSGLACVLLIALMLVTFFGTLEQVELGLYEAKHRYFESLYVIHWLWGVLPVPLPGVYLLSVLTAINLVCGGILRIKKGVSQYGVIVAHAAVVLLLVGGWIKYEFGTEGYLTLYESQQSDEFQLPLDWEIAFWSHQEPQVAEYCTAHELVRDASPAHPVLLRHPDLPFDVHVLAYIDHCLPQPAGAQNADGVVDGFVLQPIEEVKRENRIPGAWIRVHPRNAAQPQEGLLWGGQRAPLTITVDGTTWSFDLRRRRQTLPFAIRLEKFVRELHPRTNLPRAFVSEIVRIEHGQEVPARITMNEPLRSKGYTLYQASWGPQDAPPGTPLYSTFAVAYDPAERFPLYSCAILTGGLVFHFGYMLYRRLQRREQEVHE